MDVNEYINQYELVQIKFENVKEELFGLTGLIKKAKRKERKALVDKKEELERNKQILNLNLSNVLYSYMSELMILPGNEERFKQIYDLDVEFVDMGFRNKTVLLSTIQAMGYFYSYKDELDQTLKSMLDNKVIGLIEANVTRNRWERGYSTSTYGLPVRKVKR